MAGTPQPLFDIPIGSGAGIVSRYGVSRVMTLSALTREGLVQRPTLRHYRAAANITGVTVA